MGRATKSAAMGEVTVTAEMEKETVTETQTVREVTSVGGTTATGGMETTAARGIDPLSAIDSDDRMGTKFHVLVNIPCITPTLTVQKKPKKFSIVHWHFRTIGNKTIIVSPKKKKKKKKKK